MGGNNTVPADCSFLECGSAGVYGTLGTPAPANNPGSRNSSSTWIDHNGNLWLFGGVGFDANGNQNNLNDLWEFNPATNLWTWWGGSSSIASTCSTFFESVLCGPTGVYGTTGTAAPGNIPGGRNSAAFWTDNSGNFWLFGGTGLATTNTPGFLRDLWMFDPSTKEWTWMGGNNTLIQLSCDTSVTEPFCAYGQLGVYGTLGALAAGNNPGGRAETVNWTDSSGNLWLFGGNGSILNGDGYGGVFNDLWKFDLSTKEWAWMSGSNTVSSKGECNAGVYGTPGTPAPGNTPSSLVSASNWTDTSGNFWLFGGQGFCSDDTDSAFNGELNEMWEFNPSTKEWTSFPGSTMSCWNQAVGGFRACGQVGTYGTLGVPAAANIPGGRASASSWIDSSGNFWLFGGDGDEPTYSGPDPNYGLGYQNDLWEFQPFPFAASPTFSVVAGTYSAIQTVMISDATAGASIYYTMDGTTPTTASTLYSGPLTVASTLTLEAIATASGSSRSAIACAAYVINVPADFSVTAAPATMTVTAGSSGTATMSISPQGSFASAVSFACSGLPSGGACSFSPATVTPSGQAAVTTTLTVTTAATSASLHRNRQPLFPAVALAGALCLIGFRKRGSLQFMFLLGLSVAGFGLLSGCGGGSSGSGSSKPPPVISTVTVTATSGSLVHTATFSLTVN